MALSRLTSWVANQILTRNALVAEFDNIYSNALSLISPLTGNLNAGLRQITNLLLETQSSTQSAGNEGRVYYQTGEDQVHVDDGSNIRRVPTIASPTRGGILKVGSTASVMDQLAIGGSGTIVRSDGTDPGYSTFTIPNTFAQGDLLHVASTNAVTALAKDANATRSLTNTGTNNTPAWAQVALATGVSGQLPLANGGTGANLVDPNADRILFWDDSAGAVAFLTPSTGLTITTTNITASSLETGTWSDVSGSRAIGTIYENTSGKKRRVSASAHSLSTGSFITGVVGPANPPTITVIKHGIDSASASSNRFDGAAFEVPAGHFYKVEKSGAAATLELWVEMDE